MATQDENINLNINVNSDNGMKSVRAFRTEMRELTKQMDQAAAEGNVALFSTLEKKFGILKNDLKDANQRVKLLDPGELLSGYVKLAQGMVASFGAVSGAMSLFGSNSEEVNKIQEKATTIIQTMMGIEQARQLLIDGGGLKNIKTLALTTAGLYKETAARITSNLTIKTTENTSKLAAAAQWLWNTAIAANPIMIMVLAVAALTTGIVLLYKHMKSNEEAQKALNIEMEQNARLIESNIELGKTQISVMQANGRSKLELLTIEQQSNDKSKKLNEEEIARLQKNYDSLTKDQKEALNKRIEDRKTYNDKERDLNTQQFLATIEDNKKLKDAKIANIQNEIERSKQERMKAFKEEYIAAGNNAELQKEAQTKLANDLRKINFDSNRAIQDLNNKLMKEGLDKDLDALSNAYIKEKEAHKGQADYLQKAKDVYNNERNKIQQKYDNEQIDAGISLMKEGADKEIAQLQLTFKQLQETRKANDPVVIAAEQKLQQDIAKIRLNETNKNTNELQDLELSRMKEGYDKQRAEAKVQYERSLQDVTLTENQKLKLKQDYINATNAINLEQHNAEMQLRLDGTKNVFDKYDQELAMLQEAQTKELELWEGNEKAKADINEKYAKQRRDLQIQMIEEVANKSREILQQGSDFVNTLQEAEMANVQEAAEGDLAGQKRVEKEKLEIKKKYAGLQYAMTLAQIGINVAEAISKAFAQTGVLGFISAALITGIGIAQASVATGNYNKIMSLKAARGAFVNGPSHANGGVQYELEGGEAVLNANSMKNPVLRRIASNINVIGGGVPFSGGNSSSDSNNSAIISTIDKNTIREIVNEIVSIPVIVTEYDISNSQRKVQVIQNKATF